MNNAGSSWPHLQWINGEFRPKAPDQSPMLKVKVSIMHDAHKVFDKQWRGSRRRVGGNISMEGLSDTGCQACTAGEDILDILSCPKEYLIPTRHNIVGITRSGLGIVGSILLRIELNGKVSRQMVHISSKINGFFLSEGTLKDLGVISKDFPHTDGEMKAAACASGNQGVCQCAKRTPTPNRPVDIPYAATRENVPKLKKWLEDQFATSSFNQCTHQQKPKMKGVPMKIVMKEKTVPFAVNTPLPVPHHWKEQVKSDIERDVRMGVIEPVPQGTPTVWCARMVVAPKPDGNPRRTVDLQRLNKATLRETHHTATPFELVSTIPPGQVKTVLDAWNGYHSLPLAAGSRDATTFITEWGRFRYCRAPMGFHASGDAYTRRFDDITKDQVRVKRCVDDSILWDTDIAESFWHTFDYLKTCGDSGIVFNQKKFQFAEETVEFAGFEVTIDGYKPSKKLLDAIAHFPRPQNTTDIRSWFGLVNQVAYTFSRSRIMAPFRELLSTKQPFHWDDALEEAFQQSKEEILHLVEKGVKSFEVGRPTCLATDWARIGLGFLLLQKHCDCAGMLTPTCGDDHWQLVFAGSRFTSQTESRYAPIEGEALAVVYGLDSCRMFCIGCPQLLVSVDHKPLLKIFDDRALETIHNPRLFSLKERTLMYNFQMEFVPGKKNPGPDATSRYPVDQCQSTDSEDAMESAAVAFAACMMEGSRSVTWNRVKEEAAHDEEAIQLVELISNGFPADRSKLPEHLRQYWRMRSDLYIVGNVPFIEGRMLIPKSLRKEVAEGLHVAHQGITSMTNYAHTRFFWPGMNIALRQIRDQCKLCNEQAPSQRQEPMILTPPPDMPFQQVVIDFCEVVGHDFLIYSDRYSGWTEVALMPAKDLKHVLGALLKWFAAFGVPEEIASDGGPPFNAGAYDTFLRNWDIKRRLSSAYYAQSNGRAEVAVKSVKRILLGNVDSETGLLNTDKVARALLAYRNTPQQGIHLSPAVMLFGHPLRDHLPNQERKLRIEWQQIADAREIALAKKHLVSLPSHAKGPLKPLEVGQAVQIQNQRGNRPGKWHNTGVVAEVHPHRQYSVVIDGSRRKTLRNRRFVRPIDPVARRLQVPIPELQQDIEHSHVERVNPDDEKEFLTQPQMVEVLDELRTEAAHPSPNPTDHAEVLPRRSGRQRSAPDRLCVDPGQKKSYTN